jgi:hypothetical protein
MIEDYCVGLSTKKKIAIEFSPTIKINSYLDWPTKLYRDTWDWWQFELPIHCDPKGFPLIAEFRSFYLIYVKIQAT